MKKIRVNLNKIILYNRIVIHMGAFKKCADLSKKKKRKKRKRKKKKENISVKKYNGVSVIIQKNGAANVKFCEKSEALAERNEKIPPYNKKKYSPCAK